MRFYLDTNIIFKKGIVMAKKKTTKATDILGVLRAKKEQDGKLSKFGEWVLSGQSTGWVLEDKNVRYVMR